MDYEHSAWYLYSVRVFFFFCGVLGKECSLFHKHMAEKIAKKLNESYEKVITVIRCKLSFIIV